MNLYRLANAAERDLIEIARYIAKKPSLEVAENVLAGIIESILLFAERPEIGRIDTDYGVRIRPFSVKQYKNVSLFLAFDGRVAWRHGRAFRPRRHRDSMWIAPAARCAWRFRLHLPTGAVTHERVLHRHGRSLRALGPERHRRFSVIGTEAHLADVEFHRTHVEVKTLARGEMLDDRFLDGFFGIQTGGGTAAGGQQAQSEDRNEKYFCHEIPIIKEPRPPPTKRHTKARHPAVWPNARPRPAPRRKPGQTAVGQ